MHNSYRVLCAAGWLVAVAQPLQAAEVAYSEARIFFELNDTDGDLGIHASIDGRPWRSLEIENPLGRRILAVAPTGSLRRQGMTQLFFESAEPPFDELPPATFFARFPAGVYEISGRALDGNELESEVVVSHVLAAPAGNLVVNGQPAADCDSEDVPSVTPPVVISWDPVTESHPEIGESGPITVDRYQVFAEQRVPNAHKYSLDLPATATSYTVPEELIALGDSELKFEIQVRATNGNQTATESCFLIE